MIYHQSHHHIYTPFPILKMHIVLSEQNETHKGREYKDEEQNEKYQGGDFPKIYI